MMLKYQAKAPVRVVSHKSENCFKCLQQWPLSNYSQEVSHYSQGFGRYLQAVVNNIFRDFIAMFRALVTTFGIAAIFRKCLAPPEFKMILRFGLVWSMLVCSLKSLGTKASSCRAFAL